MPARAMRCQAHVARTITISIHARINFVEKIRVVWTIVIGTRAHAGVAKARGIVVRTRTMSSYAHIARPITIRIYTGIDCVCKIGVVGTIVRGARP